MIYIVRLHTKLRASQVLDQGEGGSLSHWCDIGRWLAGAGSLVVKYFWNSMWILWYELNDISNWRQLVYVTVLERKIGAPLLDVSRIQGGMSSLRLIKIGTETVGLEGGGLGFLPYTSLQIILHAYITLPVACVLCYGDSPSW